jgi:hypothetical protein
VDRVFVVALTELRGALDAEATALAGDLGVTAYETRLLLAPGMPAIVKTTPDKARALEVLARLRARGHGAVACDAAAVVPSAEMIPMRRLRLGEREVTLDDRPAERLPYDDVLALVAAAHRSRTDTATQTRETKLSVGRAVMTGGMAFTKSVKTETRTSTEERESVLYVFRTSGATPWILRERGTSWAGMGRPIAPSESENYRVAVAALRELAPGAVFDDRLVTRKAPEAASLSGGGANTTVRTSSSAGVDLLAHLVAMWTARSAHR